jgi:hypothetical protein
MSSTADFTTARLFYPDMLDWEFNPANLKSEREVAWHTWMHWPIAKRGDIIAGMPPCIGHGQPLHTPVIGDIAMYRTLEPRIRQRLYRMPYSNDVWVSPDQSLKYQWAGGRQPKSSLHGVAIYESHGWISNDPNNLLWYISKDYPNLTGLALDSSLRWFDQEGRAWGSERDYQQWKLDEKITRAEAQCAFWDKSWYHICAKAKAIVGGKHTCQWDGLCGSGGWDDLESQIIWWRDSLEEGGVIPKGWNLPKWGTEEALQMIDGWALVKGEYVIFGNQEAHKEDF